MGPFVLQQMLLAAELLPARAAGEPSSVDSLVSGQVIHAFERLAALAALEELHVGVDLQVLHKTPPLPEPLAALCALELGPNHLASVRNTGCLLTAAQLPLALQAGVSQ